MTIIFPLIFNQISKWSKKIQICEQKNQLKSFSNFLNFPRSNLHNKNLKAHGLSHWFSIKFFKYSEKMEISKKNNIGFFGGKSQVRKKNEYFVKISKPMDFPMDFQSNFLNSRKKWNLWKNGVFRKNKRAQVPWINEYFVNRLVTAGGTIHATVSWLVRSVRSRICSRWTSAVVLLGVVEREQRQEENREGESGEEEAAGVVPASDRLGEESERRTGGEEEEAEEKRGDVRDGREVEAAERAAERAAAGVEEVEKRDVVRQREAASLGAVVERREGKRLVVPDRPESNVGPTENAGGRSIKIFSQVRANDVVPEAFRTWGMKIVAVRHRCRWATRNILMKNVRSMKISNPRKICSTDGISKFFSHTFSTQFTLFYLIFFCYLHFLSIRVMYVFINTKFIHYSVQWALHFFLHSFLKRKFSSASTRAHPSLVFGLVS